MRQSRVSVGTGNGGHMVVPRDHNTGENTKSMSKTSDAQPGHESADPHTVIARFVDGSSAGRAWSAAELTEASEAFLDILRQPDRSAPDAAARMDRAFDLLVRDDQHLALHRLVLARHSSGVVKTLSSVAVAFGPRLLQLAAAQATPCKGVLMALLLLRSKLPEAVPMQRLPVWHRQGLVDFGAEEALLPYNTMFDRHSFVRNVAELKLALPELDWIQQWRDHGTKKVQTLLYYWPTEANTAAIGKLLELLESAGQAHEENVAQRDLVQTLKRLVQSSQAEGHAPDSSAHLHANGRRLRAVLHQYALRPIGLAGRRPRVAICVSGQLRGYLPALASWRKHLLPGLEADFYVHTWRQAGRSGAEPFRRNLPFEGVEFERHYREQCMKLGYQAFVQKYPTLFKALSDSSEVTADHLRGVYGSDHVVVDDDTSSQFDGWSNSRKMHYKISQVQALVDESGRDYEMVLRIRPDKAMRLLTGTWPDIERALRSGTDLLADFAMGVHYGNLMVGDQFAVGRSDAMRIYGATYADAFALETQGLTSINTFLRGHVSLARQCWLNGLHVGKFPALFGGLVGLDPLSSSEIQANLSKDAEGRSEPIDRILLAAVAKDLASR